MQPALTMGAPDFELPSLAFVIPAFPITVLNVFKLRPEPEMVWIDTATHITAM